MTKWLTEFLSDDPFIKGLVFLLVGIGYLIYKIDKKESFNMKTYNAYGWKAFISSWAIIILLIIFGITLIFRG